MKNIKILAVFPVILAGLAGCKNNKKDQPFDWTIYHEDYIYSTPRYEQINVAKEGTGINSIVLTGVPEEGIPQTRWDDYPIKLHVYYEDGSQGEVDFKEVNIPIEYRYQLGIVGNHEFDLGFAPMSRKWEFKIIENPNWKGFDCYFFNGSDKLIHTQTVGYYESVNYNGPAIEPEDSLTYQYRFTDWNRSLKYISENTQFKAQYKSIEKREYARKPSTQNSVEIDKIADISQEKGTSILLLGRVQRVAGIYSETQYLGGRDITLQIPNADFGKYWNEMNKVVQDHIAYEEVDSKVPYFYGSVENMIATLNYNSIMDTRFSYPKDKAITLEDNISTTITTNDAYDNIVSSINPYIAKQEVITVGSRNEGYYRLAVLFDVDVFLTYSYRRIGQETYELDVYNDLTISPVISSCLYQIQYSETEEFKDEFNTKLVLDTEAMWNSANSHNWGAWTY